MEIDALKKRVDFWNVKLMPLGFGHWDIDVQIVDEPDNEALNGARAAVTNSSFYDSAWMEFKEDWLEDEDTTLDEIDKVIIHEFVHVAMRDFDDAIHDAQYSLGEPAKSLWQSRVKHEREGFVDRVARSLYLMFTSRVAPAHSPDVVRSSG